MIKEDPKRPGKFYVSYGKRHPKTGKVVSLRWTDYESQAAAKRDLPKLIVAVEDRIRRAQIPTWGMLLEAFPTDCRRREVTENTISDYMSCLNAYTLAPWRDKLVDDIPPAEIRNLITTELASKSIAHQKNVLKMIKAVFALAVDQGHLKANPTPQMAFRVGDKIKAVLTLPQAQRLLAAAKSVNHAWYPVWCVALYTGLRSGELYALTWDSVDLERRTIRVSAAWNNVDGFKDTKSGNDRIVAIAPPLLHVLKELRLLSGSSEYVLPRLPAWKKGFQAKVLRTFLVGLGLPQIRFHDLRATWATILLSKGIAPAQVMAMGGWADMKTMMIYMRKAGIDVQGATDCLLLHNPTDQMGELLNFERVL
jgi:integrase